MGQNNILMRAIQKLAVIESNEIKATLIAIVFVTLLTTSYSLLRPMRDAMAPDWSALELSWLWTINFFISTGFVALYGFLVSKINFRKIVPTVYIAFSASFVLFFFLENSSNNIDFIRKSFYIWVSVFALFNLSVFWSYMADTFNRNQATRLFGAISSGSSLGFVIGSALSTYLSQRIDAGGVMLISAFILVVVCFLIPFLHTLKLTELGNASHEVDRNSLQISRNPFGGFKDFFRNPYLLAIGGFIFVYTGLGTFFYMQQNELLGQYDEQTRRKIVSIRDLIVNITTYGLAIFATGRIVNRLGMPIALTAVPIIMVFSLLLLAFSPVLIAAMMGHIALRAANYSLTRPAREMLFTVVSREDRFKTKSVIDVSCYRGGDALWGWMFTLFSSGLGFGIAAIAFVGAFVSFGWSLIGWFLGKKFDARALEMDIKSK